MPDPNDPFDYLEDDITEETGFTYGVASSTSGTTPMMTGQKWGTIVPGQTPDQQIYNPDAWLDWQWEFEPDTFNIQMMPSGGGGSGGPMTQEDNMLGGGTGGGAYGSDALYDQTGNPTGSAGYEQELGNWVAPGTSQGYWDDPEGFGEGDSGVNSLVGGGMDTDSGQYGWYGGLQSQNPIVQCMNDGGFWYNGMCSDYALDDPTGWSFDDEGFSGYATDYGTSGGNMGWFGDLIQQQYNTAVSSGGDVYTGFEEYLLDMLGGFGASGTSSSNVLGALESGGGGSIDWESLFSYNQGGMAGGQGGINFQGIFNALVDLSGGETNLCSVFGGSLPWC